MARDTNEQARCLQGAICHQLSPTVRVTIGTDDVLDSSLTSVGWFGLLFGRDDVRAQTF